MKERMKPKKPKAVKPLLPVEDEEEDLPVAEKGEGTSGAAISRQSPGPHLSIAAETKEATEIHADAGETSMDHSTTIVDAQEAFGRDKEQGSDSATNLDTAIHAGDTRSSRSDPSHSLPGPVDEAPEKGKSNLGEFSRSKTGSRLPLGKKRQPTVITPVSRVTRSTSKQQEKGAEASPPSQFVVFRLFWLH